MRIAVCDDEIGFREEIRLAVYSYSNLHRLHAVVDEFECGEDLLNSKRDYDIIILDQKMEGISGLTTARKLREKGINSIIIFLTSYPEIVFESFEVNTFRFLRKPLVEEMLNKALDDYFSELRENRPILLKQNHETICVQSKDIVYLEADNRKCYVHLEDKKYHVGLTMALAGELLPKNDFIRIHKSHTVNLKYICGYDSMEVYLNTGKKIPISRYYMVTFKKAYRLYAKDRII